MTIRGAAKWIERCLWAFGFLVLAACLVAWLNARREQANGNRELDRRLEASKVVSSESAKPTITVAPGEMIGRIEIPRLDLSTVVFEGTTQDVLSVGVGHLPASPLPGQHGNIVLAAHRDTFFRPLKDIHKGDEISVVTPAGTRTYAVDEIRIVTPDQVEVLGPSAKTSLTLVTCYPFEWFGHAPKRFIVRAHELTTPVPTQTAANEVTPPVASPIRNITRPKPVVRHTAPVPQLEVAGESTEYLFDSAGHSSGNRVIRGVKKLNPKRLWAKFERN